MDVEEELKKFTQGFAYKAPLIFTIPGKPIPLARHRSSKNRMYDPQFQAKKNFAWIVQEQISKLEKQQEFPLKSIILVVEYHFKVPGSYSKKMRSEMLSKFYHLQKPDLSNLIKFTEDALNGILWEDDSQIHEIHAKKFWNEEEKTVIKILLS